MSGRREGGKKAAATILARDPDFYKRIGAEGGKKGRDGGFGADVVGKDGMTGQERARMYGRMGGKARLGYRKPKVEDEQV